MTTEMSSGSRFAFASRPCILGGALIVLLLAGIGAWRLAGGKGGDMIDPATYVFSCANPKSIVAAFNELSPKLSPVLREQWHMLKRDYFVRLGREGFYERVNNKTVATILAGYDGPSEQIVVESGEKDGLRWTLYGRREEDGKPAEDKAK